MQLRPYQTEALDAARLSMRAGKLRPLLMAPTGSGKTAISIELIKLALSKGTRVIFTVDRIQLIDQTAKVFHEAGLEFGVIQADHPLNKPYLPLQLASVQTLTKRDLPECGLLINDECHCLYKSLVKAMEGQWSDVKTLGLSATPFTKGLGKIYDDLIVVETTQSLIDQGYLSDFVAYGPSEPDLKGVRTTAGDFNQKDLGNRVTKIIGDVADNWLKLGENRQTLCFAVNVAHSQALVREFVSRDVSAEHMDAHTKPEDRAEILNRYESGETKILSNCGITTKGFDSPNTDCLIIARPTKSLMLHIQMLGRVLRVGDTKTKAIILDHGGNLARLGFPTDDLPQFLCNGDANQAEAKKKEKKEVLPFPCEVCHYMSITYPCAACGHIPKKDPRVETVAQSLGKLEKVDMSEKRRWYCELLGYARSKGFKDGWAAHKYKEKFGVWPAVKTGLHAGQPSIEVKQFIQYLNIKNAKGRKYG